MVRGIFSGSNSIDKFCLSTLHEKFRLANDFN
jgi:hypothetical protein